MTPAFPNGAAVASTLPLFPKPTPSQSASALLRAAAGLTQALGEGRSIDAKSLRTAMETAFGASDAEGAWDWKLAYDACETAPGVEVPSGCPPDIAAGRKLLRQGRRRDARSDRSVEQRRLVIVNRQQLGQTAAQSARERLQSRSCHRIEIARDPARHDHVHHEAMAEAGLGLA